MIGLVRPRLVATTAAHIPALRDLLADFRVGYGLYPFRDRRDLGDFVFGRADADLATIFLGDEVVGAVGRLGNELLVLVAPAVQGRGIGGASLARYLDDAARHGLTAAKASVARDNIASRRLFVSAGFAECGFRHAPCAREPLVDFRRELG